MKFKISFFISEPFLLFSIFKVIHATETENPCPMELDHIVAAMCTNDTVEEESVYGSSRVDSVLLRVTKQQNNCICHVSLSNTVTNYTLYMSKYNGLRDSAPVEQNCGLAVDVVYVDTSNITRSLPPIECTSGTRMRSIELGGSKLILKSRIIGGDLTRGYCMHLFRNQSIFSCKMNEQAETTGSDDDWIQTNGIQHTSIVECKTYCLQTEACAAVHYESNYCFVYIRTPTSFVPKDGATYSQKHCVDTQKLKIRCYPPESTTQTDQVITTDDTFSTKFETVSRPIGDNHVTNSNTKSTIATEKEIIKETSTSFMVALVIAIIGCTIAVFFAGTTVFYKRKFHTQNSNNLLAQSVNYVDLSRARDDSDYSAINSQAGNDQHYEKVNQRT